MELEHRFEVPVGLERAWTHLLDMEQVAACFPGATLTSADGQKYTGSVKVKLGPVQLTYQGSARVIEIDESAHRATIEASGNAGSGSTASMKVVATASEVSADRTAVDMKSDLTITGRPAQFGRGVMVDVGNKVLSKFADCLAMKLSVQVAAGGETAEMGAPQSDIAQPRNANGYDMGSSSAPCGTAGAGAAASDRRGPSAGRRRASGIASTPEPIDLLETVGGSIIKRIPSVVGALLAPFLLSRYIKRRRARKAARNAA